ncbi:MAG: exo-alpha-sialidase [Lentisphaeria bacterium]|nr:exo-alpha-sialidase [Lentisphaeria bacterium]
MIYSEIKYQPERSKTYLGSPSIVRLPDGVLVACHDYFGNANAAGLSSIYRSEDNGKTWENSTHLMNSNQGTLFLHKNELYYLGLSCGLGSLVVRKSTDGGYTWTVPADEHSGLILKAGKKHENPNFHNSGNRVLFHNGRIWNAMEELYYNGTDKQIWQAPNFRAFVISASQDDDLLEASSWVCSNKLVFEENKFPERIKSILMSHDSWSKGSGWLEGNVVVDPAGKMYNMIRVHFTEPNKAILLDLSDDGKTLTCNYEKAVIDFVGGWGRFSVQRDPETGIYYSLTNYIATGDVPTSRNTLDLAASEDLIHWYNLGTVLKDESGLNPDMSIQLTGFQYADWHFEKDDIIYISRTAYRGANSFHNSNRITYHVLKDFRKYWENRPEKPLSSTAVGGGDKEFMKDIAIR